MRYPTLLDRIKANSEPEHDVQGYSDETCWRWTGKYRRSRTEARPSMNIYQDGKHRTVSAYRMSIIASGRRIGPNQVARHMCDHPWCVNPAHLKVGTQSQNERDKRRNKK